MAVLNASAAEIPFSPIAAYGSTAEASPTVYSWLTAGTNYQIQAIGPGFAYSGNTPLSGTVTSINVDLIDSKHPYGVFDYTITGLSADITSLVNQADPAAGEVSFWQTLLGGNDTIIAPSTVAGVLFGDFLQVVPGTSGPLDLTGGNDSLSVNITSIIRGGLSRGGTGSTAALVGDAVTVDGANGFGATLHGGDDAFTASGRSGYTLVGDAQVVGLQGTVIGGNDTFTSTIVEITGMTAFTSGGVYIGDVEVNMGSVTGGADIINGSNYAFLNETIVGDVLNTGDVLSADGSVTGGADRLNGRAGQDFIAGDVYQIEGGSMTGGADIIHGGEDSDIIAGDALNAIGLQFIGSLNGSLTQRFNSINFTGGNDTVTGDGGNDWIVGDLWNGDGIEQPSTIVGGNDRLLGGEGDDMIYGDIGADYAALLTQGGDDTLDGGMGDDILDGQLGNDTAAFNSVALAVTVDLALGTAVGQGSDQLFSIENITGSSQADRLAGDAGRNIIMGGAGDDTVSGRDGNDELTDGAGSDVLIGGNGTDAFKLTTDGTADKINGGADADALILENATSNVVVNFTGPVGSGTISGGGFGPDTFASIELVAGSVNATLVDRIFGGAGSQIFFLRAGNDVGFGGDGDDGIAGEAGNDRIDGGNGNDQLNGGLGNDTFIFSTALSATLNVDKIEDFNTVADRIQLSSAIFTGLAAGNLAGAAFVSGAGQVAAADAGDRIIYDSTTGNLYFDADGTGAAHAAIQFAKLVNHPAALSAADFVIV